MMTALTNLGSSFSCCGFEIVILAFAICILL
jgi:hypothetical protein